MTAELLLVSLLSLPPTGCPVGYSPADFTEALCQPNDGRGLLIVREWCLVARHPGPCTPRERRLAERLERHQLARERAARAEVQRRAATLQACEARAQTMSQRGLPYDYDACVREVTIIELLRALVARGHAARGQRD